MGECYFGVGRIKNIARTGSKSAVATAAYHAGISLRNEYDGMTHDYSGKKNVGATYIWMPTSAPDAWQDESIPAKERLGTIWNDIELADTSENARLARQFHLCIPNELNAEQGTEAVRRFAERYCLAKGMGVTASSHEMPGNWHFDMMALAREYGKDGTPKSKWKKTYLCRNAAGEEAFFTADRLRWADGYEKVYRYTKNGEERQMTPSEAAAELGWERVSKDPVAKKEKISGWDDLNLADEWREGWETILNEIFAEYGIDAYADRRSYAARGDGRIATVHEGRGADRAERHAYNESVRAYNRALDALRDDCDKLLDTMRYHFLTLNNPDIPQSEASVAEHARDFDACADTLEMVIQERVLAGGITERFKKALGALRKIFSAVLDDWRAFFRGAAEPAHGDVVAAEEAIEEVGASVDDILSDARRRFEAERQAGTGTPNKADVDLDDR